MSHLALGTAGHSEAERKSKCRGFSTRSKNEWSWISSTQLPNVTGSKWSWSVWSLPKWVVICKRAPLTGLSKVGASFLKPSVNWDQLCSSSFIFSPWGFHLTTCKALILRWSWPLAQHPPAKIAVPLCSSTWRKCLYVCDHIGLAQQGKG